MAPASSSDLELDEYKSISLPAPSTTKHLDHCLHVASFSITSDMSRAWEFSHDVEAFHRVALRMYRKRKPNRLKAGLWRTISRQSVRSFLLQTRRVAS